MPSDRIVLAHGGGGRLTAQLIDKHVLPRIGNDILNPLGDSALLGTFSGRVCFTTDSFVVQPLRFPGGDIGRLAVCGTVNDLAVMGALPRGLSLSLIIEEGLELAILDEILDSIGNTLEEAGVHVVTGDTKVIEHSRGDGLMITTAGVGEIVEDHELSPNRVRAGDAVIVSGRIAEHGIAVMSAREGLSFRTSITSDVAPLNGLAQCILKTGADVRFLRDPTRGGLAGVLNDIVETGGLSVEIEEERVPLSGAVRHAAEMLGLDPLTIANEGKLVAVVADGDSEKVLAACRAHPLGANAALIGTVTDNGSPALVEMITPIGGRRIVQRPYGEELPRIC